MASNPVPAAKPLAQLGDVSSLAAACGEPAWLAAFREQAAALARSFELPDRARHLWRFTDPAQFLPQEDPAKLGPGAPVPSWSWQLEEQLASAVLLAGPTPHLVFLAPEASQAGVEVVPLGDKRLASYLGKAVPADHGFLEALNAAAFRPGVAVLVPAGVRLEHPIRLRVVASSPLLLPRVLLVVGENASVEVLEGHVGDGGMVLGVTEAFVADGGELRYDLVQRWDGPVVGHLTSRVVLGEGARARLALASFGGRVTKVDTGAILAGKGAEVETYGVCLGIGEQHFDHHTEHIHQASKTQSNLDFKVALAGKARSVYTGLIRIAQDAAGCEAYQENRNLLLAENARAESIPELEILNEDVRCTHGATVAPLDEEQVFYLRSRGLPQHQAMRLIVYGFLDQTLSRLPQATRERIEALVAGRLHGEVL